MPEQNFDAEVYFTHYICDECGVGEMKSSDSNVLLSDPPQYTHKCDHCGNITFLRERYPALRYYSHKYD